MTTSKRDFWVFGCSGEDPWRKRENDPYWAISTNLKLNDLNLIMRSDGPIRLAAPLVGEAERSEPVDVALSYQHLHIVSDRVRHIVAEAGPTDCQFIPIDIQCRGKSLGLNHWVMHVLRTVECADPEKSLNLNKVGQPPFYMLRTVIVPEQVPPDVSTFRLKHGTDRPIIRDSLRRNLVQAKVTGCLFDRP